MASSVYSCYNPAACRVLSNCSTQYPYHHCNPDTEYHLSLKDIYFHSKDQLCKGVTCCELIACTPPPPPSMILYQQPALPVLIHTSTFDHENDMDALILIWILIPFAVFLIALSSILYYIRVYRRVEV